MKWLKKPGCTSADNREFSSNVKSHGRDQYFPCYHSEYAGFHDLKTRRSGPEIFIEFHLVMPGMVSVLQSYDLADHFESDRKIEFPRATITIHTDAVTKGTSGAVRSAHSMTRIKRGEKTQE